MKHTILYIFLLSGLPLISCQKYLDKTPDVKLAIPTSLTDFQRLLDYSDITDQAEPALGDMGCDDYYFNYSNYQSQSLLSRNCYAWVSDIFAGATDPNWNTPYTNIYKTNVVLEGLANFTVSNQADLVTKSQLTGSALFIRAFAHYNLEEVFGQPYRTATASSDLGIPLKLSADLSQKSVRSTVEEVYAQIIRDLQSSLLLLPATASPANRPSKPAAYALLARVFLSKQDYARAGAYADSALQLNNTLYDYNGLSTTLVSSTNPFSGFAAPNNLPELYYPAVEVNVISLVTNVAVVDSILYNSYAANDLRKSVFFNFSASINGYYFKGKYTGSTIRLCCGPSTDEMYLIRAECNARLNNATTAMADLNVLLSLRWKTGTYVNLTATDANDALAKILVERRKELLFRGLRWSDLRRLNQDSRFAKTLTRNLNGQVTTLAPNDPKYTYPIPNNEIQISGMPQNAR